MNVCPHCSSKSVSGRYCGKCGKPVDISPRPETEKAPAETISEKSEETKKYDASDLERLENGLKNAPDNPDAYLKLARAQIAINRLEAAYSTYRAARAIEPDNLEIIRSGAEILTALNRREEAIKLFQRVIEQNPRDIDSTMKLVELLYDTGQKEKALNCLNNIENKEKQPAILIRTAQIHLSMGNASEAQQHLKKYRQLAGNTREMFLLMGQTMLTRKFFDGAVKNFKEAVNYFPGDASMRLGLGKAYLGMGEKGQALLEFEQGLKIASNDIQILLELGKLQNAMGMDEQADKTFSHIESSENKNGEDLLDLARHFIERNKLNRAKKYLQQAHELSPYNGEVLKSQGEILEKQKKFVEAEKIYKQMLAHAPEAIWAHAGIIRCADNTGDFELKARSQQKLLEIAPPTAELWCDYGETLIKTGDFDKAQTAFEKAAALDPTCVRAYQAPELIKQEKARANGAQLVEQAREAIAKKFYLTATERLEKALKLVPGETEWTKLLAEVSINTADTKKASALLSKVRAKDPADYQTSLHLARVYEAEGKIQLAIELLSTITKDHPLELDAHLILLRLKRSQLRSNKVETDMFSALIRNIELELAFLKKESPVPLLVKGYACYLFSYRSRIQQEGFKKAEAAFNEAIEKFGENEESLEGLSLLERAKANSLKAVDYTKNLVRISSDPRKLYVLARLHENFQHFSDAKKCYESLKNLFPENGLFRKKLIEMIGEISNSSSKNELLNYLSELNQNIQSKADQVWLLYETALVQQFLAEHSAQSDEWRKKSLLSWHKAANHLRTNHWVRWGLLEAQFKFLTGVEKQRAAANNLKACEKILREIPDNSLAQKATGQCYLAFGDLVNTDKALNHLEKAWFLSHQYSDTGFLLAKTGKELGRSVVVDAVGYNMILLEPEIAQSIFQL
ncbi:MAG: tetratricopeptide repeat protein [Candidatus Rifleibacteriota bacterium]